MTEDTFAVRVVDGRSLIRVVLEEVTNAQGFVRGFNVVIRNLRVGEDFIIESFLMTSPEYGLGSAYRSAYQWGYRLSGVLECDYTDLPQYGRYLKEW